MTSCPDFGELLNDYFDGLLSPPDLNVMERHLEGCVECKEALAALRALRDRAAALPRSLEPPRDLWPGIRNSLPPRRGGVAALISGSGAGAPGWGRLGVSAAGAFAILVIAFAVFVALRREGAPGASGQAGARPAEAGLPPVAQSGQASLQLVEAEYRRATEQLQEALRKQPGLESQEALRVLEENLRIVEGAIQEVHRAAEGHPGEAVEKRHFANLYRTRFQLLREAVRLFSRGEQEDQS